MKYKYKKLAKYKYKICFKFNNQTKMNNLNI